MPATKHCPLPASVLAVLHSHRKDLTPPHSPQAAAGRAESCRRSGSGRLCPRIFTFDSIPKKFGGNSDRRHDPHAERASRHTCAHPSSALRATCSDAPTLEARTALTVAHTKPAQQHAEHAPAECFASKHSPHPLPSLRCCTATAGPYYPTRRWQQRSGRNHAGEAAAVAFVPEFSPSVLFPKNSGATAIGGMIRTRSGLPRTHALIRRTLYALPAPMRQRSKHGPHPLPSLRCCTATARTLLPHSPQAAAERAESCRRSGSGRLCPRIFTFDSIPKKFGGNSDRRHDPHAQRASPHTCAHPSNALRATCSEAPTLCTGASLYAIPRTKQLRR